MKKTMVILTAILVMAGCTRCSNVGFGEKTNEYDKYLVDFNNDLVKLGYPKIDFSKTEIFKVKDIKGGFTGVARANCDTGIAFRKAGYASITVSKSFIGENDYVKKAIIYHEIGHCFLGLDHSELSTKWLMSPRDIYGFIGPDDMNNESKRLDILKQMLEVSGYK